MPSPGTNGVKYDFDSKALKTIYDKDGSLIEIVCQSADVFKNLGLSTTSIKINTL
jgi:hypothetical protein